MNSTKTPEAEKSRHCLDLKNVFYDLIVEIYTATAYHNRRSLFFKRWHFFLLVVDWIRGTVIAFWVFSASFTEDKKPYLFNKSFDFSKKCEKHRWLTASYIKLKKEVFTMRFISWKSLDFSKTNKYEKKYHKMQRKIASLIKKEYPTLHFLKLVSHYEALQELSSETLSNKIPRNNPDEEDDTINDSIAKHNSEDNVDAINSISYWQHLFINILSMPRCAMRFEQKIRKNRETIEPNGKNV